MAASMRCPGARSCSPCGEKWMPNGPKDMSVMYHARASRATYKMSENCRQVVNGPNVGKVDGLRRALSFRHPSLQLLVVPDDSIRAIVRRHKRPHELVDGFPDDRAILIEWEALQRRAHIRFDQTPSFEFVLEVVRSKPSLAFVEVQVGRIILRRLSGVWEDLIDHSARGE